MATPDAESRSADTQFKAKVEQLSQFKLGVVDLHATCANLLRTMRDWTKFNKEGVTRWDAFLQSDLPLGAPPPLATASTPAVKFPPESVIDPMRGLNAELATTSHKWMMQDGAPTRGRLRELHRDTSFDLAPCSSGVCFLACVVSLIISVAGLARDVESHVLGPLATMIRAIESLTPRYEQREVVRMQHLHYVTKLDGLYAERDEMTLKNIVIPEKLVARFVGRRVVVCTSIGAVSMPSQLFFFFSLPGFCMVYASTALRATKNVWPTH
jgi:hypothetical protein